MKQELYLRIEALCRSLIAEQREITAADRALLCADDDSAAPDFEALISIYSTLYHMHVKRHSHEHKGAVARYVKRYENEESIHSIARSINFSPYLIARMLVESLTGMGRKKLTATMKSPSLIRDDRLRAEVEECIRMDTQCSPYLDRVRHSVGQEFEFLLQRKLLARKIAFESEDDLRRRGVAKTPDARLIAPIGVRDAVGELRLVHWIDSKAMFGDPHTHRSENLAQLRSYVNRFGPGLVIYWFDFVEELNDDPDVLLTACFPRYFTSL